jgi:hypothetical protein
VYSIVQRFTGPFIHGARLSPIKSESSFLNFEALRNSARTVILVLHRRWNCSWLGSCSVFCALQTLQSCARGSGQTISLRAFSPRIEVRIDLHLLTTARSTYSEVTERRVTRHISRCKETKRYSTIAHVQLCDDHHHISYARSNTKRNLMF